MIDLGKGAKRYKETLKSRDLFVAEGIVTRPSVTAAAHWARRAPQAWLIRQIRAHPPLFHAADALLRRRTGPELTAIPHCGLARSPQRVKIKRESSTARSGCVILIFAGFRPELGICGARYGPRCVPPAPMMA